MTDLWRLSATDLAGRIRRARSPPAKPPRPRSPGSMRSTRASTRSSRMTRTRRWPPPAVDAAIGPWRGRPGRWPACRSPSRSMPTRRAGRPPTACASAGLDRRQDSPVVANLRGPAPSSSAVPIPRPSRCAGSPATAARGAPQSVRCRPSPRAAPRRRGGGHRGRHRRASRMAPISAAPSAIRPMPAASMACGRPSAASPPFNLTGPDRHIGAQLMAVPARSPAPLPIPAGLRGDGAADARDPWWTPAPLEGPAAPARRALRRARGHEGAPEVEAALRDAGRRLRPPAGRWRRRRTARRSREPARTPGAALARRDPARPRRRRAREADPDATFVYGRWNGSAPSPTSTTSRMRCSAASASAANGCCSSNASRC